MTQETSVKDSAVVSKNTPVQKTMKTIKVGEAEITGYVWNNLSSCLFVEKATPAPTFSLMHGYKHDTIGSIYFNGKQIAIDLKEPIDSVITIYFSLEHHVEVEEL